MQAALVPAEVLKSALVQVTSSDELVALLQQPQLPAPSQLVLDLNSYIVSEGPDLGNSSFAVNITDGRHASGAAPAPACC